MIFAPRKPDLELDELMARARNAPPMTDAEIQAQRESWVRAEFVYDIMKEHRLKFLNSKEPKI